MIYRLGGVADWPAISGLLSHSDYYGPTNAAEVGGRWLVAEHDGQIVGTVWAFIDTINAYVDYLYVAPRYRKTPVPAKLLANMHEYLSNLGVKRVYSNVRDDNQDAKRLVEGFGMQLESGYALGYKEI